MLAITIAISIMAKGYTLLPQDGSDIHEKESSGPVTRPLLSIQRKSVLVVLGIALVASLSANVFSIYKQFFKPWELYDELPTKYGMSSLPYV